MSPAADRPRLPLAFRIGNLGIRLALVLLRVRVVIVGAERVPDEPGYIVAMNHLSIVDPPVIAETLARITHRRVRFMAKAEAMSMPLVGWALRAYGGFGVRRGRPDRDAYRMARQVLEDGDWLGVAPEGTRSRSGHLGEPKAGVALLALRSAAPVLPIGISGTEQVWPVGARLPRFGKTVTVEVGQPFRLEAAGEGAPRREGLEAENELIMRRIAALLPPAYRGRFG